MTNRNYNKQVDSDRLTLELVTAGYPRDPSPGARFYGVITNFSEGVWTSTILCYDDLTDPEKAGFDAVVAAHIPLPLPEPTPPVAEDGKPYVRAEVRPLDCTTYFTSAGDTTGIIGGGKEIYWDFSNSNDNVTPPTGFKRKIIDFSFIDFVYLKSGIISIKDVVPGSYLDYYLIAPAGSYILVDGQPYQLPADMPVAHFVNKMMFVRDGSYEIDPQTVSGQIPAGYIFRIVMTVPESDVVSKGAITVMLYRQRTIVS